MRLAMIKGIVMLRRKKDGKRKHGGADRKHDAKKVKTDRKNVKCLK